MVNIGNEWDGILKGEFEKEYYLKLREFLKYEYSHYDVYPNMYDIFNSLKYTSYNSVKAVILGQDPYHEPGQAHGLCFSVKKERLFRRRSVIFIRSFTATSVSLPQSTVSLSLGRRTVCL